MSSTLPIMVGWKVLVEPKRGKEETESGLDISATVDAQEHLVYIGKILEIGESAFTARTQGGIDMSEWRVRPQKGDSVIYQPYTGMRIRRKGDNGKFLMLMNDTDIMAIIDDPDQYYSWIEV